MQVWVCLCIVQLHTAALPAVEQGSAVGAGAAAAISQYIYFDFLSAWCTAHIIRKYVQGLSLPGVGLKFCGIFKCGARLEYVTIGQAVAFVVCVGRVFLAPHYTYYERSDLLARR